MTGLPEDERRASDDRPGRPDDIITSPANPTIKLARSLHRRRMRYRERALLVEGPRAIETAIENGAQLRALLLDANLSDTIDRSRLAGVFDAAERVIRVESRLFHEIADTEHPQPLLAIASLPDQPLPLDCSLVLVVDGLRDPGNLGTLIRSAAAAGADAVALLPGTVDPTNPKVVRSSAGCIYVLPVVAVDDIGQLLERAFARPAQVVLAEAGSETPYDMFNWKTPTILVVGSEGAGIGEQTRTFASATVSIPMAQKVESLNAAVSGSILLFAASRRREHH